jgi:hypothetical protein
MLPTEAQWEKAAARKNNEKDDVSAYGCKNMISKPLIEWCLDYYDMRHELSRKDPVNLRNTRNRVIKGIGNPSCRFCWPPELMDRYNNTFRCAVYVKYNPDSPGEIKRSILFLRELTKQEDAKSKIFFEEKTDKEHIELPIHDKTVEGNPYFPLAVGNEYEYSISVEGGNESKVVILYFEKKNKDNEYEVSSKIEGRKETEKEVWKKEGEYIILNGTKVFKYPFSKGNTWKTIYVHSENEVKCEIIDITTLDTLLGELSDVVRVRLHGEVGGGFISRRRIIEINYYFAKNIGLVRLTIKNEDKPRIVMEIKRALILGKLYSPR